MSYHEITIIGNLGRDPDMTSTPNGQAVTNLSVAANRKYRNGQGERVKETTWFQVKAWGQQAKAANEYLHRGSQVMVKGRLIPDPDTGGPRMWERKDGSVGASFDVTAREIVFLGGGNADGQTESGPIEDDIPF